MSEQTKRVRLYAGVRLRDEWNNDSTDMHHVFYEQDENGEIADTFRYAQSDRKDAMNAFVIGGYYECTITSESKMVVSGPNGPKYMGQKTNQDRCTVWYTESQAARQAVAHRRSHKKDGEFNYIAEALAPIKQAMNNGNRVTKRAIIMLVLEELNKT